MTTQPTTPNRRNSRRLSTVGEVLETGLRILSAEGIEAVSMRRLAGELGLSPMAIYSYVETKDELLDGIAALALGDLVVEARDGETWQDGLIRSMTELHDALRNNPGVSDLLLSRPPPIATLDGFR
ncbi:MAG: TetR/AcrR family transcriptional regulator, partial [Acidimicrobiia bacterium]